MTKLKYYVPVKLKAGFTNLSVDKFKEIKDSIPSIEIIRDHLQAIQYKMKNVKGARYEPITVMVSLVEWETICKKIEKKTGTKFTDKAISVIIENQQAPIIQIIQK